MSHLQHRRLELKVALLFYPWPCCTYRWRPWQDASIPRRYWWIVMTKMCVTFPCLMPYLYLLSKYFIKNSHVLGSNKVNCLIIYVPWISKSFVWITWLNDLCFDKKNHLQSLSLSSVRMGWMAWVPVNLGAVTFLRVYLFLEVVPVGTDLNCIVMKIVMELKFPIKTTVDYLFVITFSL
jgi:hypothetical protein